MSEFIVADKNGNRIYQGTQDECNQYYCERNNVSRPLFVVPPLDQQILHTAAPTSVKMDASAILVEAAGLIKSRASERDVEQERSMATAVKLFSEITANDLTEYEGWMFMACLKMARNREGTMSFNRDHLLDCMAYLALALESKDAA